MHLMIRPIMPYDIPKLTENPFVLISGFVLVITAVLIAVVLSRYVAEVYKGNKKKATLFFVGITAFVTLMLFCFFGCAATAVKGCIFCLLLLSDTQLSYITNVEAGRGLMKVGSALVPFVNKFPKNTKLYALMTTKFGER